MIKKCMIIWMKAGLATGNNRVRCGVYGVWMDLGYKATVSCDNTEKNLETRVYRLIYVSRFSGRPEGWEEG